jgi:hypothetical protein
MSIASVRGTGPLDPSLLPSASTSPARSKPVTSAAASASGAPVPSRSSAQISRASTIQGKASAVCSLENPAACIDENKTAPKTFFINGIRTPEKSAQQTRDLIEKKLGGTPVELLYNPTHGIIADGAESLMNITGMNTKIAKGVQARLRQTLDSGEKVRVFAHSQGAAITGAALHDLAKAYKAEGKSDAQVAAIMARVEVISFGGFADQDSFPKGVKFNLNREKEDSIPQLATSCLAIGKDYREVCAEPKKVQNWLDLGGSILSGLETTGKAIASNTGQAVVSAYRNRDSLWDAFGKGKVFDSVFKGDLKAAGKEFNSRELDAYCAQIGQDVCADHLTVILDPQGKASAGYVVKYFEQNQNQERVA